MNHPSYASAVAEHLTDYVTLRRELGYELCSQVYVLGKFDRVLQGEMGRPGPVTREMVESFLSSLEGLRATTRRVQLSTVRRFLVYLRQFEPETFVPDRCLKQANSSPRTPHIYTHDELEALLREALRFPPRYHQRRWIIYHTLIAFLYATGMRISEALALKLGDINWPDGTVHIRKTKFHKSRLVPLKSSSVQGLQRYLSARAKRGHPTAADSPLFVTNRGGPLPYSTALHNFNAVARMAGLRRPNASWGPRIHDLRHTAAVRRLYLWYQEGKDVQALLPALATYLGHSSIRSTEIYLTVTLELLVEANARFERAFPLDAKRPGGMS